MTIRSKTVHFRVTPQEHLQLEEAAAAGNTTVSRLARRRVMKPPQDPNLVRLMGEVRFLRLMLLTLFEQLGKGAPLVGPALDLEIQKNDALKISQALRVLEAIQ